MNMKALLALVLSSALTAPAFATAPNAAAPKGGNFVINLGGVPPTLQQTFANISLYVRRVQISACDWVKCWWLTAKINNEISAFRCSSIWCCRESGSGQS
jgi:hypothetical protein